MVHFLQFVHLFCCSSSTKFLKPEIVGSILALNHKFFYASKSRCETKGFLSFDFFRFFPALCDFFFENFRILSKGNPLHFLKFSVCKNV